MLHIWFKELFWKQFITPLELARKNISVFLVPNPPIPFFTNCPTVVIIPDLAFYFDQYTNPIVRKILYLAYRLTAARARKIITISFNSKIDITKLLLVPESKIAVVHLAADSLFRPMDKESAMAKLGEKYKIDRSFVLAVPGSLSRRKNMQTLLYAYSGLPADIRSQFKLVIIARKVSASYSKILITIERLGLASNVIITGYVPHEEMPLFYNAADLLIYPSLYEGFGLPPLEAMACGTPVIVSNRSSLPEVVGEAGILVDPTNVGEITLATLSVMTNRSLREELISKGLERARFFSWEDSALSLLRILEELES